MPEANSLKVPKESNLKESNLGPPVNFQRIMKTRRKRKKDKRKRKEEKERKRKRK